MPGYSRITILKCQYIISYDSRETGIKFLLIDALFLRGEDEKVSEMFDNPLYGSTVKSHSRAKDQDHQQTEFLTPGDPSFSSSKAADGDLDRPPVPTPRNRSFTCSENKPQPPINLHPPAHKKPVVPSRSEGATGHTRPPLPAKSRPEPQITKPRDYRDTSEFPKKHRLPARPGQPQPHSKNSKEHL